MDPVPMVRTAELEPAFPEGRQISDRERLAKAQLSAAPHFKVFGQTLKCEGVQELPTP